MDNSEKQDGLAILIQELGLNDREINEEQFNEMMQLLTPQQELSLREYYGISDPKELPSKEEMEMVRSRVQEIEREALRRLRSRK